MKPSVCFVTVGALTLFAVGTLLAQDDVSAAVSGANCTFQASPDRFLGVQSRVQADVSRRAQQFQKATATSAKPRISAEAIPRQNFIDNEIFGAMAAAQVQPAPLTTDEEFFRRINLDLTGRLPAADDVRAFVASTDPNKRNATIEQLLYSPQFADKWAMWLGDIVQNNVSQVTAAVNRQIDGRNQFYSYLYWAVRDGKSMHDVVFESLTMTGNNYDQPFGAVNFLIGGSISGGPAQDTYDGMLVRTATAFLGMGNYDCLLCHNGFGHLTQINLWGSQVTRTDAEKMAAFFSRTRLTGYRTTSPPDFYTNSTIVSELSTNVSYDLNTNYGNRPNRVPVGSVKTLTPVYQATGATPKDGNWRAALAQAITSDPMFARNFANRIWKAMFNLGLVEPVDQLDPARLDPQNPPPDPWTMQASNPVLLEKLAQNFRDGYFDLRGMVRLIAQSSAYQLSSRYDGDWNVQYVPLFARHYPRRLDAEEIHDAISTATGVFNKYTVQGWSDPISYAMQFPDTSEPRNNGAVTAFLNGFLRGNRDTTFRSQAPSILQQLNLMNDNFVASRTKVTASPTLTAMSKITDNNALIDQMFLTFLSRLPSDFERAHTLPYLQGATTAAARNTVIEDLAWVCINKLDFVFSY